MSGEQYLTGDEKDAASLSKTCAQGAQKKIKLGSAFYYPILSLKDPRFLCQRACAVGYTYAKHSTEREDLPETCAPQLCVNYKAAFYI